MHGRPVAEMCACLPAGQSFSNSTILLAACTNFLTSGELLSSAGASPEEVRSLSCC